MAAGGLRPRRVHTCIAGPRTRLRRHRGLRIDCRMPLTLTVAPHPLLCLRALDVGFPHPLAEVTSPVREPLAVAPPADVPEPDDALRAAVRDLLRHGGFKPTGRSKPSSEYLVRAAQEGTWPVINAAVDVGNVVSLRSGIPISVVDLDRTQPPLRVEVAPPGAQFAFNAAGQVIDVGSLLGLADAEGPCANAVKDAQRTKTSAATTRVLVVLWGTVTLRARTDAAARWASELLVRAGGRVQDVACAEARP